MPFPNKGNILCKVKLSRLAKKTIIILNITIGIKIKLALIIERMPNRLVHIIPIIKNKAKIKRGTRGK